MNNNLKYFISFSHSGGFGNKMKKLSELSKETVIIINDAKYSFLTEITKEDFLESFEYDDFLNGEDIKIYLPEVYFRSGKVVIEIKPKCKFKVFS